MLRIDALLARDRVLGLPHLDLAVDPGRSCALTRRGQGMQVRMTVHHLGVERRLPLEILKGSLGDTAKLLNRDEVKPMRFGDLVRRHEILGHRGLLMRKVQKMRGRKTMAKGPRISPRPFWLVAPRTWTRTSDLVINRT